MSTTFDPSLFQPTVAEEDDATAFRRPWNPHSILFVVFFGGLIASGVLFYLNCRRLGLHKRAFSTLLSCIAAGLIIHAGLAYLVTSGVVASDGDNWSTRQAVRFVNLAVGLAVCSTQMRRYRLAMRADAETASLIGPGLLAIIASIPIDLYTMVLFLLLFKFFFTGAT